MFGTGPSYNKLKTNLRLSVNRLKLMEKKKTELAQKARREIADYLANGKDERAKIRVEHIIREDYLVEAMELVEMYCDLLLARFGLLQQMKTLDEGLAEAISSLLWAAPRLQTDVAELKVISDQLTAKYGKQYTQACRDNAMGTVNEKLMHKLSLQAPPRILVEKYLIEIAKSHNVPYEPDPEVMQQDEIMVAEALLIDFNDNKNRGFGGGNGGAPLPPQPGMAYPPPPGFVIPPGPPKPFQYPTPGMASGPPPLPNVPPSAPYPSGMNYGMKFPPPDNHNLPPVDDSPAPSYDDATKPPRSPGPPPYKPVPAPRGRGPADTLPELPSVPDNILADEGNSIPGTGTGDDVDFDDLTKRFEELKKRK